MSVINSGFLSAPVITIDGPSGTGKGTVSRIVARALHWHYLDSGALYRALALAALQREISLDDIPQLTQLAKTLCVEFKEVAQRMCLFLEGIDQSAQIRSEFNASNASKISVFPSVREALLERQRAFRQFPGLVTDGRDMGTVVFPDAQLKFFLTANAYERSKRRWHQLKKTDAHVTLETVLRDIEQRDLRDKERQVSPLKPAKDAIIINTTLLSVKQVVGRVLFHVRKSLGVIDTHKR